MLIVVVGGKLWAPQSVVSKRVDSTPPCIPNYQKSPHLLARKRYANSHNFLDVTRVCKTIMPSATDIRTGLDTNRVRSEAIPHQLALLLSSWSCLSVWTSCRIKAIRQETACVQTIPAWKQKCLPWPCRLWVSAELSVSVLGYLVRSTFTIIFHQDPLLSPPFSFLLSVWACCGGWNITSKTCPATAALTGRLESWFAVWNGTSSRLLELSRSLNRPI